MTEHQIEPCMNVKALVHDAVTGDLLYVSRGRNIIVNGGLTLIRDLLGGTGFRPDKIAVGTGTATPDAADTALGTQVFSQDIDRRIPTTDRITFQMLMGTADGNGNTLSEAGLFESSTLVARSLLSPTIPKTSSILVTVVHEVTIARPASGVSSVVTAILSKV